MKQTKKLTWKDMFWLMGLFAVVNAIFMGTGKFWVSLIATSFIGAMIVIEIHNKMTKEE